MRGKSPFALIAAVIAVAAPAPAAAQPGASSCSLEARDVNFGIYDPNSTAPNDTSSAAIMRCDCAGAGCGAIHYRLEILDNGGQQARSMSRPGRDGALRYELYADPSRTVRLGKDDEALSGVYQPSHFGEALNIPVYGRIAPLQRAGPGAYGNLLTVVVTY